MSKAFDLRKALDAAVLGTFRRHVAAPAQGADGSDAAIADALYELRDRFLAAIEAEARKAEARKDEARKDEARKDEARKDEARKDEAALAVEYIRVVLAADTLDVDRLARALRRFWPCICDPIWTDRHLADPACWHHDAAIDAADLAEAYEEDKE